MTLELEEVVGLFSKQPAELVASLKGDDGEWKSKDEILGTLRKVDKDRLDTVAKGESGKAVRLRMKKAQDFIKQEYGIESDANEIEDHLKLLVEKLGQPGKETIVEKLVELDEATALTNPIVQKILKSEVPKHTSELQRQLDEEKKRFKDYVDEDQRRKLDGVLYQEALKVLVSSKAALDKDEATKEKQVKRFMAGLKSEIKFKLDDNGKPYPVDANGEPLSENYQEVSFADLIKRENIFGVHNYDPDKDSAGATTQTRQQQRPNVQVPTTLEAYKEALNSEKDPAKKRAIMEAYVASQEKK